MLTERKLPPYRAQHNLAPAGEFSSPRDPGLDPEALVLPSFHVQKRRYRTAQHLLDQLLVDHPKLVKRARDAQKSSFPSPGAGGSRSSGTSDPTARVALRSRVPDPAERALDAAATAIRYLRIADQYRERALAMTKGEGILAELDDDEVERDDACPSHARAGLFAPAGDPKDVGKDSTLCQWCHRFNRAHDEWPSRELLRILDTKGRVTVQEVERSLRAAQSQKPPG